MLGRHSGFAEAPPTFCQPSMGWYHGSKGAGSRHARCDAQVTTLAGILMRGSRQGPAHSPRVALPAVAGGGLTALWAARSRISKGIGACTQAGQMEAITGGKAGEVGAGRGRQGKREGRTGKTLFYPAQRLG